MYQILTGRTKTERVVLKEEVTREAVIAFAGQHRWRFVRSLPRTGEQHFQYIWATEDDEVSVNYNEDAGFGFAFLSVKGEDREAVGRVAGEIRAVPGGLPHYTDTEAIARFEAARTRDEGIGAIYLISLVSPKTYDPDFMPLFERAVRDPNPDVRVAAIFAMSQTFWPEFHPVLAEVAEGDSDAEVRDTASTLLEGYKMKENKLVPA